MEYFQLAVHAVLHITPSHLYAVIGIAYLITGIIGKVNSHTEFSPTSHHAAEDFYMFIGVTYIILALVTNAGGH